VSRWPKKTQHELDFIAAQACEYRCGLDGCGFTRICRHDVWLQVRDDHSEDQPDRAL
jgi:hypothetical protein